MRSDRYCIQQPLAYVCAEASTVIVIFMNILIITYKIYKGKKKHAVNIKTDFITVMYNYIIIFSICTI
jgi:hypothetical protein